MFKRHEVPSPKLGLKGPRAADWLRTVGLSPPDEIYHITLLDEDSRLLRIGTFEYIIEGAVAKRIADQLAGGSEGVYRVERQEITIDLVGDSRYQVLEQTCGLNPEELEVGKIYYTRVAGATAAIIPHEDRYELWVDPSLADYLSETLKEIVASV